MFTRDRAAILARRLNDPRLINDDIHALFDRYLLAGSDDNAVLELVQRLNRNMPEYHRDAISDRINQAIDAWNLRSPQDPIPEFDWSIL